MGIRDRIKRRLPIIGMGGNRGQTSVAPRPAPAGPARAAPEAPKAPEPPAPAGVPASQFIDELVKNNPVVVFMKGSPASPMCGFSANAAGILGSYGRPLVHFDVLSDPEVRQGVKEYSEWPTIPQIYVGGEFLGGSDILRQMHENGELKGCLDEAFSS